MVNGDIKEVSDRLCHLLSKAIAMYKLKLGVMVLFFAILANSVANVLEIEKGVPKSEFYKDMAIMFAKKGIDGLGQALIVVVCAAILAFIFRSKNPLLFDRTGTILIFLFKLGILTWVSNFLDACVEVPIQRRRLPFFLVSNSGLLNEV